MPVLGYLPGQFVSGAKFGTTPHFFLPGFLYQHVTVTQSQLQTFSGGAPFDGSRVEGPVVGGGGDTGSGPETGSGSPEAGFGGGPYV